MKIKKLTVREQVVEAMSRVYKRALTTTSGGNISATDDNGHIFITPSGIDKGTLTAEDIAEILPDGKATGKYAPSMELPFHRDIYRTCKDVRAIVHAHSPAIVAYACMRVAPDSGYARVFEDRLGKIAPSEYALPGSLKLGGIVRKRFEEGCRTVMMDNHGATVAASDMGEALAMYETLDALTQTLFYAAALGGAKLPAKKLPLALKEYPVEDTGADDPEARKTVAAFVKRAYAGGLVGNGYGTLAVRSAGGIFFNADSDAPYDLDENDIVKFAYGKLSAPKKAAYLDLILKIFEKRPEANAVFISAPAAIMGFAVAGVDFDARLIPESYIMLRDVTRLPYASVADFDAIASALSVNAPVAVIDNECAITIGKNATKAFDRMEVLDYSARSVLLAKPVAAIRPIEGAEVDEINDAFNGW